MSLRDIFHALLSLTASASFASGFIGRNPILHPRDRSKLEGILEKSKDTGQIGCAVLSCTQLTLGLAESLLIITNHLNPTSPFTHTINSIFLFNNSNPTRLHLSPPRILGALMLILGGQIRLSSSNTLGKFFTYQVGIQQNHKLITTGPYAIVRHPSYTAMMITHPGCLLWNLYRGSYVRESGLLSTPLGFAMTVMVSMALVISTYMIIVTRTRQEDKVMQTAFGDEWEEWAKRVPYLLVPGVY
ncbi:hypothetical protein CVT24_006327 [Panaeolus cyanescens]|uniref:Protein-S-isoprenylcysteine O-methyltransferase n=1 Tax=Panaeolus cyanescens TaxID=181874 RepID=A0A409YEB5_9AGAR|nr:hypothetical protein CVT24_006327 [Panaeolus cyanescens]